jgi:hypothetical protein
MRPSLAVAAIHPLLVAAYAVLFLYAENIQLVRPAEVFSPLIWSIAGAAVLLLLLTAVFRDLRRGALLATALLIVFFGYGHLAGMSPPEITGWPLLGAWSGFVLGIAGLLLLRRDWLPRLTGGLNVAALVLVLFSTATIVPYHLTTPATADAGDVQPSGLEAQRTTQRDIYYIVPDRYGSPSSLAAEYGITDNDLYDWLEERGFDVARESYANYSRTSLSMASVLNLAYLDSIVSPQPPDSQDYGPVHRTIQEHLVGRFLREQGYRYVHIGSWFNPTRSVAVANENLESDSTTEFQAVLDATTALPLLAGLLREEEAMPPEDEKHVDHAQFQVRAVHRVIDEPGPKFVLLHILLPHDPYTFDEEGNYVSPEERRGVPVAQQFRAQLEYTNTEIKRIVQRLLDRPEAEQPIIIVQADEGPFPERYEADHLGFDWSDATPDELNMKFGIINAFYLPTEPDMPADVPQVPESMTSVNTYRLLFERYFGIDLPFLPDRVFVSASPQTPYDLTEVTDLLPGPQR